MKIFIDQFFISKDEHIFEPNIFFMRKFNWKLLILSFYVKLIWFVELKIFHSCSLDFDPNNYQRKLLLKLQI